MTLRPAIESIKMLHQDLSIIVDGREINGFIPLLQLNEIAKEIRDGEIRNGAGEIGCEGLK
jgi:hypothetical protein